MKLQKKPKRMIRNFTALAATPLRRDALAVLEAGLCAIDTGLAVREACRLEGSRLRIRGRSWDLSRHDRVFVVAAGKAAYDAAVALEGLLGARLAGGIVLDVKSGPLKRLTSIAGTHPFPSGKNVRATRKIAALLDEAGAKDLVITVVSGGSSALLTRPHGITSAALAAVTKRLMAKGADIREMNVVRKHLDGMKGGGFARLAYPATVIGLIFSDVPGDDLAVIGSGPTVRDTATAADAAKIMARLGIPKRRLLETPKDRKYFKKVSNLLIVTNGIALSAMAAEAKHRGYAARILSKALEGEAREVGRRLAAAPRRGEMVLAAGETTVTLRGKGRGGRNQELALGALSGVSDDGLVLSCASDGIDNTPAAGAIADAVTRRRAAVKRLDPTAALAKNASYDFFKAAGQQIITGRTGANVSDFMIAARAKRKRGK